MNRIFNRRFCSFTYLNIAQFLGALNDNVFKLLIIFSLIDLEGVESSAAIMAKAGAVFVIPFLLFSSAAGKLADCFSKRNIIVLSKLMEVIVMALGTLAFFFKSPFGSYATLFLMALQSAIFSPSKYGIVPEIVDSDRITKANGLLTSFTILAIISGTFLASFITDISGRHFVLASCTCTMLAIIGFIASLYIEHTPPAAEKKKMHPFFLYEVYKTLARAKQGNRLLAALLGCAYFMFLGAFIQLNLIPYGIQSLQLTDTQGGYLFMFTALGIGTGSIIAGKLSGKHVELGLVPIGGLGLSLVCFLLYSFSESLFIVLPLTFFLGAFGGIFEVPIESFIQAESPEDYRGQMVATSNFLGFIGVLFSSAILSLNANILNLQPSEGFVLVGILTLISTLIFAFFTLDYFFRFLAFTISRLCFRLTITNNDPTPLSTPALILCDRPSSVIDTLLLTAIQKPPLRFLIESNFYEKKSLRNLCRMMRIILIPPGNSLGKNRRVYFEAKRSLDKGYTVFIFTKSTCPQKSAPEYFSDLQKKFERNTEHPVIPVSIDEKPSRPTKGKMIHLLKEFPWHVSIGLGSAEDNKTLK